MLTREEGERMAEAIHRLRPDWPVSSLFTFISARKTRPHRDLALELVYVALDPKTDTPARIDQDGPWKRLGLAADGPPKQHFPPIDPVRGCHDCMRPADNHPTDHPFVPPQKPTPPPADLREHIPPMGAERE